MKHLKNYKIYKNTYWLSFCLLLTACSGSSSTDTNEGAGSNSSAGRQNTAPVLSGAPDIAKAGIEYSFNPIIKDVDGDQITISATDLPAWLIVKDNGVTGIPTVNDVGEHSFSITASDGKLSSTLAFSVTVNSSVYVALATGNALAVTNSEEILDAALAEIEYQRTSFIDIKRQLFKLDSPTEKLTAIDWDPTNFASILKSQSPLNNAVLFTTNSNQTGGQDRVLPIAIAGSKKADSGRYLAFGGNPFKNTKNAQMEQFLHNSLDWLSQQEALEKARFNLVFTQLDDTDRSQTRAWFDSNISNVSYNENGACDGAQLAACISAKPDLIIVSNFTREADDKAAAIESINNALANNIPVIYVQRGNTIDDHGKTLLSVLNVTWAYPNKWWRLYLSAFDPATLSDELPADSVKIKTLLTNFKNKHFNVDLTNCATRSCPAESNMQAEFFDGVAVISPIFNQFNNQKINIFEGEGYRFHKLLILLADHYRQTVIYPMDKMETETVAFLKSMYADSVVYNTRDINPAQPDMGNFSRSDFSHITPENAQVTMMSKPSFRSAGVYALPGQTFTITRTDNTSTATTFFINTLRTGATHIYNTNKYNRPQYVQSGRLSIAPGESVKFTSSYGGPIQIGFAERDIEVSFNFENIGRHPHWRTPADDVSFAQKMEQGDYDWAEIATEGFEVHSKLEKLRKSLADSRWPEASDFANATYKSTHNMVNVYAGFKGPGIDEVPEIHDFVTQRGLSISTIDIVKHMNADQPTCGWGCSGNPYDAGWDFNPVGHGDLHELGHGIERSSMRFGGYGFHSSTNFYSIYANSVYHKDYGTQDEACWSLGFEGMFNALQASKNDLDPLAYMEQHRPRDGGSNVLLHIQLMIAAKLEGTMQNGWLTYPRFHIWDREMARFSKSAEAWATGKVGLGFNNYTLDEFKQTTHNDRLMISLSEITQLNLTDWFKMYGYELSPKAVAQIATKPYKMLPEVFYLSRGGQYCEAVAPTIVPVDGKQVWPAP